jgi:alpha-amylase
VKHIDRDFISKFVKHIREHSGKDSLFAVGEYWKDSERDLSDNLSGLGTQVSF